MTEAKDETKTTKRERVEDDAEDAAEPPTKQPKTAETSETKEDVPADTPKEEEESAADKTDAPAADAKPTADETADVEKKEDGKGATADVTTPVDGEKPPDGEKKDEVQPESKVSDQPAVEETVPVEKTSQPPVQPANVQAMPAGLPPGFGGGISQDPNAIVEEKGSVSAMFVGRVIGKGGEMIRDLQARSSCRIDVDQNVPPGQPRVITYRGTRRTIDFAKHLVHLLCQENASEVDLPLGDAKREFLVVPAQSVGKIIGRGGEMIRELQSRSQAKIQVDHNGHNGMDQQKQVTITGAEQAVVKAKEMISFLVANPMFDAMQAINMLVEDKLHRGGVWGSGPPYVNLPNMGQNMQPSAGGGGYGYDQQPQYGGGNHGGYGGQAPAPHSYGQPQHQYGGGPPAYQQQQAAPSYGQYGGGGGTEMEIFYAAKNFMGRIIGQKGVTINDLQRRSSCDIQINQDVPPGRDCEISIRGSRQGIEMVKQMLREIIEIGPNHPYAGGGPPAHMGGYQQGGYGQQAPHQGYNQQGNYGHGYNQGYNQGYGQGHGHQGYQAPPQSYGQPQGAPYQQAQPQYAPPPAAPQMSAWKTATSPDGQVYYYNDMTGVTQWEKPAGMP